MNYWVPEFQNEIISLIRYPYLLRKSIILVLLPSLDLSASAY